MPNLTLSIPHQLTREEAKRRIQEGIATARQQVGNMIQRVEENWDGYKLHLSGAAQGQTVTGEAVVEENAVNVSVALPWMFALFGNSVRQRLEQEGRQLLAAPKA